MQEVSIVIPIYNEADNIVALLEELEWVMHTHQHFWEIIFVDDGSLDASSDILEKLVASKPHLRYIKLKQNYGQTSAFAAGVRAARGEWVISLDGDGQNDPQDIPLLIQTAMANPKIDLVVGQRRHRHDPWYKRLISKLANHARNAVLADNIRDSGCSLKMYRKRCFEKIPLFNGMHRFLPALFQIEGFSTREVVVHHRPRRRGKSKYHLFNRGISLFFDLLAVAWMKKRRLQYVIDREYASKV